MKILYFTYYYEPETMAASFRATDNSKLWKQMKHRVTVFTGYPNYPLGKIFDGYDIKLLSKEKNNGIDIIRSKITIHPNTSLVKRLQNALSYYFYGMFNIFFNGKKIGKDYDVVLGTSGIIFNAMLAKTYASLHRIPFVFEIRDITYKQLQATGKSENSLAVKGMKWLELHLCRKASKVVVVTNGYKKILSEEGISEDKIEVVTNGVDIDNNTHTYDGNKPFELSYFGTLGISQNIGSTFKYAEAINKIVKGFSYLIIGGGAQKEQIEKAASKSSCIKVLPGMSAEELEPYYNDTQMSVIALRKSEDFKYTIPSKLFQVMGRGIAVLFIGPDGESAEIVRKYKAGITLTGTKAEDIKQLKEFFSNHDWMERLKQMGINGRAAVEKYYSRTKLAEDYIYILDDVRKK